MVLPQWYVNSRLYDPCFKFRNECLYSRGIGQVHRNLFFRLLRELPQRLVLAGFWIYLSQYTCDVLNLTYMG
jgi:hypothetical protein